MFSYRFNIFQYIIINDKFFIDYIVINNIYVIFKLLGFPIDFRQGSLGTSSEV